MSLASLVDDEQETSRRSMQKGQRVAVGDVRYTVVDVADDGVVTLERVAGGHEEVVFAK